MYRKAKLLNLLTFDIETIPAWDSFDEMPKPLQKIWLEKYHFKAYDREVEDRKKEASLLNTRPFEGSDTLICFSNEILPAPTINDVFIKAAGLHPEFAKIYCISFGLFEEDFSITVETFCEKTEKETIQAFLDFLNKLPKYIQLAGYNIAEFDIPFILKRMWINKIFSNYPSQLQLKNAKPWNVSIEDHMTTWKAGARTNVGLGLVCEIMGIKTPKDKFSNHEFSTLLMTGKISKAEAIEYCEKDVIAVMELMLQGATDTDNNYENELNKR